MALPDWIDIPDADLAVDNAEWTKTIAALRNNARSLRVCTFTFPPFDVSFNNNSPEFFFPLGIMFHLWIPDYPTSLETTPAPELRLTTVLRYDTDRGSGILRLFDWGAQVELGQIAVPDGQGILFFNAALDPADRGTGKMLRYELRGNGGRMNVASPSHWTAFLEY